MLGAIIGDIIGSTKEQNNIRTEAFDLVPAGSYYTEITIMTLAVAEWLVTDHMHSEKTLIECMQRLARRHPEVGYSKNVRQWMAADTPLPYKEFDNAAAACVSPIGMYAKSMDEAEKLASIVASALHTHPESIKGAKAIAAAVYMQMEDKAWVHVKDYMERTFGYDMEVDLEEMRSSTLFRMKPHDCVRIAILAFLKRLNANTTVPLAISMGGSTTTVGSMACAIASAHPFYIWGGGMYGETVLACEQLLPADLLDIDRRFNSLMNRPLEESYMVTGRELFFAGEYPGAEDDATAKRRIDRIVHFGVNHFIDLTEEYELRPYRHLLPPGATYTRFPIKDMDVPPSIEFVHQLLRKITELKKLGNGWIYLHCRGGVGRTGTIVACYKALQFENPSLEKILQVLRNSFSDMPKSAYRVTPETEEQVAFIDRFIRSTDNYKEKQEAHVADCIRGCLMAGAAGDALGYTVEFMSREAILAKYGEKGITQFDLDRNCKALISDDTQMTLFTANGILRGLTRGCMRGFGGVPENYVSGAYLDWYFTQTGKNGGFHCTWLRDLPELSAWRAPGNTCLSACESLYHKEEVLNNSKGCGGIMRVAPRALLDAAYAVRGDCPYSLMELAESGAEIARITHKHPLGFLPAALLTVLIYKLVPLTPDIVRYSIDAIVDDTLAVLADIYPGEYQAEKQCLKQLTQHAMYLAYSQVDDAAAIRELGEGWTGEEAWAIALYSSVRHVDSVRNAIVAAVNHDGDSDSTGSIAGNIMGAIHGYEALQNQNLFCPPGHKLEETLELSEIILALANDLVTGCIISEYDPIDTPAKKQWYARYCDMKPAGIGNLTLKQKLGEYIQALIDLTK